MGAPPFNHWKCSGERLSSQATWKLAGLRGMTVRTGCGFTVMTGAGTGEDSRRIGPSLGDQVAPPSKLISVKMSKKLPMR